MKPAAAQIMFLTRDLGYDDTQAGKIVSRWGTTGKVESVDRSPIYHSLRKVEEQGRWAQLGNIGIGIDDAQQVMHIILKPMYGSSEQLKDRETNESTKQEKREINILTTKHWLEQIENGRTSRKSHSRKAKKSREH